MTASGRMVNWSIELSEYGLEFRPRKSIKSQAFANFVAKCSFQKPQETKHQSAPVCGDQLEETQWEAEIWSVYVDGSSAPEGAGAGILLVGPEKEEFKYSIKFTFPITKNPAEYEALLAGLQLAKRIRADKLKVFADSQLVVRQVSGEYEVKDPTLKAYNRWVKQLWQKFSQIQITQIPSEENSKADELSRVDFNDPKATKGILIETLNRPSTATEKEVMIIEAPDWRSPIIEYLKSPAIATESEAAKLRIRTARYILIDDVLYKKSFNLPYLRCLGPEEAQYALREIHEGICGQHMGGRSLSYKALR